MINIRDKAALVAFGKHLKQIRQSKKLTLEQLANSADIEISQVHRIEMGKVNTTLSTLISLSKALSMPLSELTDFVLPKEKAK